MDSIILLRQKNTLAEYMILSGAANRPPMLDKDLTKKYAKLSAVEKIQVDCDMKATNIILKCLPADIYSLVNHHRVVKDLWERVQLQMQGTTLTKQERECKLYDASEKFTYIKGETLHNLPPEWSKFVTDVKLVKDLYTTYFDQLHAYIEQHELHVNEGRLLREHNQDPFAFVDLDTYDIDCDDISNAKAVPMANFSNYGSDVISEVPYFETYLNDMENQEVPSELPRVSLVNASLKKLKFHLAQFDSMVKKRTTPDARTEAQLQDKDTTICKLKDIVKSMREKSKKENVNYDYCKIETKNVELENSVAKVISKNERLCNEINHVKQELLVFVRVTCPNAIKLNEKKVDVTPKNMVNKVRITSTNVVPPKKTTSNLDETQKPELKVYSKKPRNVKNVGSSKKAKIVESKNANHSKSNHTCGSNTTDIPSSSSLVMIGFQDATAPRAVVLANSLVSTSIDQDAPSTSIPSTQEQEKSLTISQGFKESPKTLVFRDDPIHESLLEDLTSQRSLLNVRQTHTLFKHLGRWTKDHPITNMIDDPSRSVFTRKQLKTDAMWCYFDAFLTSIEPKNFKQGMTEPSWIDAVQEEIYKFERLEV
nr:integrase, catalytic region, zinc finger, CCHC-type, peptidase aspartic, catalytic [Tanacetum cinerariifolium]